MLVLRASKLPLFTLVHNLQPNGSATLIAIPMPPDAEHADFAMELRIRLICRTADLKRMSDTNLQQAQRRCIWDHDKRVWFEPTYTPWGYISVKHLPLSITAADGLVAEKYLKLRPVNWDHWIVSFGPEVVRIMQAEVKNTVSIN